MKALGSCACAAGAVLLGCGAAVGQWNVVPLSQNGARSLALAAYGFQQGGEAAIGAYAHPVTWEGSAWTRTDLLPAGFDNGRVNGISGEHQVGVVGIVTPPGASHAALWAGTAASFVDLSPGPGVSSQATAVAAHEQVGGVQVANATHAVIWHGSASSMIDLHPPTMAASYAWATDGAEQGGQAMISMTLRGGGDLHAALWRGTAASFIDLHPPGYTDSRIFGVGGGYQVGSAAVHGELHGGVWTGSPETFVDLGAGVTLWATDGVLHVGSVNGSARLWRAAALSDSVDLGALLPPGYESSTATAVYQHDGRIWVAGTANAAGTHGAEAFLWVSNPCPANCDGSVAPPILNVADFVCFQNRFVAGDPYANCDGSTTPPVLNVQDFLCFMGQFAAGCH